MPLMADVIWIRPFYFTKDDRDHVPLCPGCYELKGAQIHLIQKSGDIHICPVCRFEYHNANKIYEDYMALKRREFFEECQKEKRERGD